MRKAGKRSALFDDPQEKINRASEEIAHLGKKRRFVPRLETALSSAALTREFRLFKARRKRQKELLCACSQESKIPGRRPYITFLFENFLATQPGANRPVGKQNHHLPFNRTMTGPKCTSLKLRAHEPI
jgi:hypothetical protein